MKEKREAKAGAAKVAKARPERRVPVLREVTKSEPVPRPVKVDPEVRKARAAAALAHFHRHPFPPLVEREHDSHGPTERRPSRGKGNPPKPHRGHRPDA